jgi:hypothetical protein
MTPNLKQDTGGIFKALLTQLDTADASALEEISKLLGSIKYDAALVDEVANAMFNYIESAYKHQMQSVDFKNMVHNQVYNLYKESMAQDGPYPRTEFGLIDRRAADFLERSDLFYLGKYISDPATKTRVLDYIKKTYIENGAAIGNSRKELNAFMNGLGYQLELERWQARRIIDTTVSNARVYSQLNGLRQAMVKTFQVTGPDDNKTCSYCKSMLDRSFTLSTELTYFDRMLSAGPDALPNVKPFLKGSLDIKDVEGMDDGQLQDLGFALPPFHPHCRHNIVAETFYENSADVPYAVEVGI